jgi:opacity protein-like surface antigen
MKTRMTFSAVLVLCVLLLLSTGAGTAHALYLGNPAPNFKKGDVGIGLSLSDLRDTAFLDWGLSDNGTLELLAGNLDVKGGSNGTELGVTYRHKVGQPFNLGKFPVTLGIEGGYRAARVSTNGLDLNYNQIHLGLGGSFAPIQNLNVYGTVVFERAKADTVLPVFGKVSGTETNYGLVLGTEYWVTPALVAGLEVHPGLDDDNLAIFGEFKF